MLELSTKRPWGKAESGKLELLILLSCWSLQKGVWVQEGSVILFFHAVGIFRVFRHYLGCIGNFP